MKKRLDVLIYEKGLAESREKAQALILAGNVLVNDKPITRCGEKIEETIEIRIKEKLPYVSRGGLKLEKALHEFNVNPKDRICLDVGASTGGFTDVLLQKGAKKVYAVDVGTNQLSYSLRTHERVVVLEKTNAKNLPFLTFEEKPSLAVIDVSFISLTSILEPVLSVLEKKCVIALVKPQFEVGDRVKNFKGIVKTEEDRLFALERIADFVRTIGLGVTGATFSPIKGPKGNIEFFLYLTETENKVYFRQIVEQALKEAK